MISVCSKGFILNLDANTMKYKFLPDVAIADVAFEAYGKTLEELFENAALATESVQVDLKSVKKTETKSIEVKGDDVKDLLFNFLQELVYLKDAEQLLFSAFKVTIAKDASMLKALCEGEQIADHHRLESDVKAVTLHMFDIVKRGTKFVATVVLDI